MAGESISYRAMVNNEIGAMAYTTHNGNFGLFSGRTSPVGNGIGATLARLARRLSNAPAAQRQREVDQEIAASGALRRTPHGQHGARNDGEGAGVRLEPAAVRPRQATHATRSHCGSRRWSTRLRMTILWSPRFMRAPTKAPSTQVPRSSSRGG